MSIGCYENNFDVCSLARGFEDPVGSANTAIGAAKDQDGLHFELLTLVVE
jgi:hypothetical protein